MLAQHFIQVLFGLDPMEINGLFDRTIDPLLTGFYQVSQNPFCRVVT